MTGTKVVIIVLVVIAALFVVLMVWGSGNNSSTTFDRNHPPSALAWLGQLTGGSSFDIKQLQPQGTTPQVTGKTFDLARTAKFEFKVSADSDHTFRQAAFKVQPASLAKKQSCAEVQFIDPAVGAPSPSPSPDDPNNPKQLKSPQSSHDKDNDKWNDFTITIPKGGGYLVIARTVASSTAPCTVTLQ